MKNRDKKILGEIADLLSQQGYQTNTRSTPAPNRSKKRTYTQAEKYSAHDSDDEVDDSVSENGKKKNVDKISSIKHGTKAAKFLKVLTNNFDLTYQEVKPYLISNEEAYHPHTFEQCRKYIK